MRLVASARGRSPRDAALRIAAATAAVGPVAALVYVSAANGYFMAVYLLAATVSAMGTALVMLIRTARTGDRRATLTAAVFGTVYALALLAIPHLPSEVSHVQWDGCARPKAVAALERYRAALGRYPAEFRDIQFSPFGSGYVEEPFCCTSIGPGDCYVSAVTNWLYTRSGNGYALGYWRRYPLVGARVCHYLRDPPGWACAWNDWTPFAPPP